MGMHTGEPLLTDEGYVGIDVHRAARIASVGHGGQILVSRSTRDLAGPDSLRDLGDHRLKDLTAPVQLHHGAADTSGWSVEVAYSGVEAADDPDVAAIKLTLYRAGTGSPIVDALIRAAARPLPRSS